MIVLDTNIVSELMRPAPASEVEAWLGAQPSTSIFISAVTEAEMRFGMAEGFRTPALCRRVGLGAGPASESLVRRKPRGGRALFGWARRDLWGFGVADGTLVGLRGPVTRVVWGGSEDAGVFEGEDARAGLGAALGESLRTF